MVGPGIWRETLKNVQNEKHTLQDLEYGDKTENRGKCETHIVGHEIQGEAVKNMQDEKQTLQDQEYGEKQ